MGSLGFLYGISVFGMAVKYKKPLRKAAVFTASQLLFVADRLKTTAFEIKEEVEDIVAEAQYENIKNGVTSADKVNDNNMEKHE